MKALDRAIARFCYKHPKFGIKNLMLYIVFGTAAVYLLGLMDRTNTLMSFLLFDPHLILRGQVWRLVTFLFIPESGSGMGGFGDIFLLMISLYFYYFIGSTLERQWGTARFTIYYLSGVLLNILFGFLVYYIPVWAGYGPGPAGLDPMYLNLSLFFAFASIWPDSMVLVFFIIPVKMKWLAWLDAAFFLVSILLNMPVFPLNLLPVVAILNFFLFCGDNLFSGLRRGRGYSKRRAEFRANIHQVRDEEKLKNYRHKCSVCGRTDVTNPELEFRYCSKCAGYHCFCEDHINSHVHFTE